MKKPTKRKNSHFLNLGTCWTVNDHYFYSCCDRLKLHLFIYFVYMYIDACVSWGVCVWKSKDNLSESVDSECRTQVVRFGGTSLSLLNQLFVPLLWLLMNWNLLGLDAFIYVLYHNVQSVNGTWQMTIAISIIKLFQPHLVLSFFPRALPWMEHYSLHQSVPTLLTSGTTLSGSKKPSPSLPHACTKGRAMECYSLRKSLALGILK